MLSELGEPVKIAQAILGHANIDTTLSVYTHSMPESERRAEESSRISFWTQKDPNRSGEKKWDQGKLFGSIDLMARLRGFEPPTFGSGDQRSIQTELQARFLVTLCYPCYCGKSSPLTRQLHCTRIVQLSDKLSEFAREGSPACLRFGLCNGRNLGLRG